MSKLALWMGHPSKDHHRPNAQGSNSLPRGVVLSLRCPVNFTRAFFHGTFPAWSGSSCSTMSQPRWEVCLGSEFVDYDLESQHRLERAMQAGEVELQLLLAGRAFTVAWTRAGADDCWDIAMRSDAHPERVRPVRRHTPPRAAPAPERARAVEPEVKQERSSRSDERGRRDSDRRDPRDERERDRRRDDARRSDGSGRSRIGGASERGGGTASGGTSAGGSSGGSGGGGGAAAAEASEADDAAPLRRRHLAAESDEEVQLLGKDKVRRAAEMGAAESAAWPGSATAHQTPGASCSGRSRLLAHKVPGSPLSGLLGLTRQAPGAPLSLLSTHSLALHALGSPGPGAVGAAHWGRDAGGGRAALHRAQLGPRPDATGGES